MSDKVYPLGRRIAVRGATGSGKSTLARALGEALALPVIELDSINWQRPDWQGLPRDEFRAQVEAALAAAPDGWIVEGNYTAVSDIYLAEADTLVWIHLPWRVSFFRVVKRTFGRARRRELLWGVQRESLRTQFFSKDSLFLWAISHHQATERGVRGDLAGSPHLRRIELRSAGEVEALLAAAQRSASGPRSR